LSFFTNAISITGVLLEFLCVVLLLRGAYRTYPFLLVSCMAMLFGTVAVGVSFRLAGFDTPIYRHVYWTVDVVDYFARFLVVVSLIYQVTEGTVLRGALKRLLPMIAIAAIVLPFVLYHPYFTGRWFRHTSQLLNLSGAFLNLLLWTAILGRKGHRDRQLLLVSVGIGISVTSVAITYGVLQFMGSSHIRWLPDMFKILAETGGAAIWCWAFWPKAERSRDRQHPLAEQSAA
jgi:hypothetical protein